MMLNSTEIGRLNRKIKQSVSGVFKGERGATGEAIGFAKRRESLLVSKPLGKKIPAWSAWSNYCYPARVLNTA